VVSLVWSVSNRTDGLLTVEDLQFISGFEPGSVIALEAKGLWRKVASSQWLILDFGSSQTSRDDLELLDNARRRDREKKQRQRSARKAGSALVPSSGTGEMSRGTMAEPSRGTALGSEKFPREIFGDITGKERQGQARTGRARPGAAKDEQAEPLVEKGARVTRTTAAPTASGPDQDCESCRRALVFPVSPCRVHGGAGV
jgi:hypothetical protein